MTRNEEIIAASRTGESQASLSRRFGLTTSRIRRILLSAQSIPDRFIGKPRPKSISLWSAVAIFQATGYWPDPRHASELADRKGLLLRFPGRTKEAVKELEAWLLSLAEGRLQA